VSPPAAKSNRTLLLLGGAAALAALVVVLVVVLAGGGDSNETSAPGSGEPAAGAAEARRLFAGVPQSGTTLGKPRAPSTLLVFADLQCPFCRDFALNALPAVVDRYVRPGKLRVELREIAIVGPDSLPAAAWAQAAARQDRLYEFADLFYRNQGQENTGYVTDEFLAKIATGAGMNVAQARRFARSPSVERALSRTSDAARSSGLSGTPSFFAGRGNSLRPMTVGSYDPDTFTQALDGAISGG
jgi:protein-disulfide isomerase